MKAVRQHEVLEGGTRGWSSHPMDKRVVNELPIEMRHRLICAARMSIPDNLVIDTRVPTFHVSKGLDPLKDECLG
jgi:hypothetical protein